MGTFKEVEKPKTVEQFKKYILQKCKPTVGFGTRFEQNYISNQQTLFNELKESGFWEALLKSLKELDVKYQKKHMNLDLIPYLNQIELKKKKVNSVINKTFRINILKNFPVESEDSFKEFVLPENIFEKINDIIRTEIIVKYIDGIDLILQSINKLAEKYHYEINVEVKSKEVGYYAKHIYLSYNANIVDFEFNPKRIQWTFEIQIRTQLQDTIKSILHKDYEKDRIGSEIQPESCDWRWKFRTSKFVTNYIGHILHFFDGIIVQIKDKGGINENKS